jgi:DNA-binding MarR family transcriptional regulator
MSSVEEYNKNGSLSLLLHDVSRRVARAFDKQMEPLGLTRSQWGVIIYVASEPGIAQTGLADKLEIGRMAVTGLVDRMESKGLVERRDDPKDRRIKRIFLSESARAIVPKMQQSGDLVGSGVFRGLSIEDRNHLIKCLLNIRDHTDDFENLMAMERAV